MILRLVMTDYSNKPGIVCRKLNKNEDKAESFIQLYYFMKLIQNWTKGIQASSDILSTLSLEDSMLLKLNAMNILLQGKRWLIGYIHSVYATSAS